MLPTSGEVPFDGSGSSPDLTDALVHNGEVTAVQAGHEAATSSEKKVQNAVEGAAEKFLKCLLGGTA